jgi:hypothetical protein
MELRQSQSQSAEASEKSASDEPSGRFPTGRTDLSRPSHPEDAAMHIDRSQPTDQSPPHVAGDPDEHVLPPQVVATPSHAVRESPDSIQWWRPSWGDVARSVGWRWILLTPAVGLVLLYAASWYVFIPGGLLWLLEVKLAIFVASIAVSLAAYVARRAARARQEPFCIYCGYNLTGLPDNYRCPECGRPYTWRLIDEYRRDPHWFIERWRIQQNLPTALTPFEAGPVRRKRRARDGTE